VLLMDINWNLSTIPVSYIQVYSITSQNKHSGNVWTVRKIRQMNPTDISCTIGWQVRYRVITGKSSSEVSMASPVQENLLRPWFKRTCYDPSLANLLRSEIILCATDSEESAVPLVQKNLLRPCFRRICYAPGSEHLLRLWFR
jgi:hypothetical protein